MSVYDKAKQALQTGGNVYDGGAKPYVNEKGAVVETDFRPQPSMVEHAAKCIFPCG